jgi:hypothetical protein
MRSRTKSSLRPLIAGLVATGCSQLCGCHKAVMAFGPSAQPDALEPDAFANGSLVSCALRSFTRFGGLQ